MHANILESLDNDLPITHETKHDVDWSKSHCGVMLCSFEKTIELMPEVDPILKELIESGQLELSLSDYAVDVKVHQLMPKQWPCIPNWHRDFIPRDANLKRSSTNLTELKMFMWLSGPPLTEYYNKETKKSYFKAPQTWHSFTQHDLHRGSMSNIHTWRCFIRVIPKMFIHKTTINAGTQRRHCQVYLDSTKFNW